MNPIEKKIADLIKIEGPITFERFMDIALYDPDSGYYTSQKKIIGREGDFYTSAYLHPVFGKMIGMQIEEMWRYMGSDKGFTILEMGAGEGYIARDILSYLCNAGILSSFSYLICEISPALRQRQRDLLADFSNNVQWIDSIEAIKEFRGCVFSNELLDAFPVHKILINNGLKEGYINLVDGKLVEETCPLSLPDLSEYINFYAKGLPEGYLTEVNLRVKDWINNISESLSEGFVFTIDYGYSARDYYAPERNRGTLLCYHEHKLNENPLDHIGEQDITAHVNFSSLARWGEESGLKTVGFCSQGAFLVSLGIDKEIELLSKTATDYLFDLARIKKIIMPQGMGESHMVMIQYKGQDTPALKGFDIRNQARRL